MIAAIAIITLLAHGWYDPECCTGQDCKAVPCSDITSERGVFSYRGVPAASLRASQDGECHACTAGGKVFCIYIPWGTS